MTDRPMSPERWRQVREIFDAALARPAEERETFLAKACAEDTALAEEVASLLTAHDEPATVLERGPLVRRPTPVDDDPDTLGADREPTRLGPYLLERRLGRGGMGTVYLGIRADRAYHQKVAVKLLKRGLDTDELIQRFRTERQILASLDHPNITKLLDGGTSEDGRPFLVMEHVDGTPIDAFCDRHRLSIHQRVTLFRKVCDAVQVAHQSLIVHRDLKPGNILVTQAGEPKLLDFGIAKLLSPESFPQTVLQTMPGALPMTPAYASPEQTRGQVVGTASDIYALGVVLYELLTGRRPYDVSSLTGAELADVVREQKPAPPSMADGPPVTATGEGATDDAGISHRRGTEPDGLRRRLRGDLDKIVLMALRKDPQRRYPSAERLSEDLRRYLAHEPVSARPDAWSYRAAKFVRRHRAAVALTTTVFVALVVLVGALWLQRRTILDERDHAQELADVLVEVFELPDPARNRGLSVTAKELLDDAMVSVEGRFKDQPALQADLSHTIGRTLKGLGLYPEAADRFEQAWHIRSGLRRRHDEADLSLTELAGVETLAGDYAASEAHAREALASTVGRHGDDHPTAVAAGHRLAHVLALEGRYDEAEKVYRNAIASARRLELEEPLAELLQHFGILLRERARYDEGEGVLEEAIALFARSTGERHPGWALATNNLGVLLLARGNAARAQELLESAAAVQRRLFSEPHPELATALNNLGRVMASQGDLDQAENLFAEALEVLEALFGKAGHPNHATTLTNLADLRADQGRNDEAEALYREALDQRRRLLGEAHPAVAESLNNLARILQRRGEFADASARFEEALAISRQALGEIHPQGAAILTNLGQLAHRQKRFEDAEDHFLEALEITAATLGECHPTALVALVGLGDVQRSRGQADEAEATLERALAMTRADGQKRPDHAALRVKLAEIKNAAGHYDQAEPLLYEALAFYEANLPADHLWTAATRFHLAVCLVEQGKITAAEPYLLASFERLHADLGLAAAPTRDMLDRLIRAYEVLGRGDRVTAYRTLRDAPTEPPG